jgi:hypothetical protein
MQENKEGLELLKAAIEKAGYTGKVHPLLSTWLTNRQTFVCVVDSTYLCGRWSLEWMLLLLNSLVRRTRLMILISRRR